MIVKNNNGFLYQMTYSGWRHVEQFECRSKITVTLNSPNQIISATNLLSSLSQSVVGKTRQSS